jgi:hypothetical protein
MGRWFSRSRRDVSPAAPTLPIPAHLLYGGAFPFCGMTLPPSAGETMLEALLYPDARVSRPRTEPTPFVTASSYPHAAK